MFLKKRKKRRRLFSFWFVLEDGVINVKKKLIYVGVMKWGKGK